MRIPRLKPGLIVTLAICASIILFRAQAVACMIRFIMVMKGQQCYCPFPNALDSLALSERQHERTRELSTTAQLVVRDPGGFDLYRVGEQQIWIPTGGSPAWFLYDVAEQERGIYNHRELGARPGDIVLDAGANIGLYAREALRQGARMVIAIEPVPANLECLRRNLKAEISAGTVIVCPEGVWNQHDFLEMHVAPDHQTTASFVKKSDDDTVNVKLPLTTVDKIVSELHLPRVDFIKMDIEGAERKALEGAHDTIRRYRPRLAICVYHLEDDPVVIPALVKSLRPDYQQQCGTCTCENGRIAPQVYFYF